MHYAVHRHTAAELIYERADANKEHMGLPGRKNPESRCDGGQKLPEQRGNELSGAHRVALSGLCRIAGRTENPHEHGGLGKASGRLFGVQRQRTVDRPR